MSPQQPLDSTRALYAIDAKTGGEALAHCITRTAFLQLVIADSRTRDLFSWWGHSTGLDGLVDDLSARLDAAATRADLPHPSAFHDEAHRAAFQRVLSVAEQTQLQQLEHRIDNLLLDTRADRARFAIGWIVAELYGTTVDEEVPIRAWLASDLLTMFDAEINGRIWGTVARGQVAVSPTLNVVPPGNRPKQTEGGQRGEHLIRDVRWYYLATVAVPKLTPTELARERNEASGRRRAPKDYRPSIADRVDTKLVRKRIDNARRLLELTVPPEQWTKYFASSGLIVGDKLVH